MILKELKIHQLRNLAHLKLHLHPRFTFISGPNGSGKTSILEALYLLSCGHSFRAREILPLIQDGQTDFTVFARGALQESISLQKSNHAPPQIKLNAEFCKTTSQLAYALPCQVIYSDIFQILEAGPNVRRTLLDWGVFHVKPNYLYLLKNYKKILKQRNALLKKQAPYTHFIPWDEQLSQYALEIDTLRQEYIQQWQLEFENILAELADFSCTLSYLKGWDKKQQASSLFEVLAQQFSSDSQRLYTQSGAHQADLCIEVSQQRAKQFLSRGQQKIILIALKLSQAKLLGKDCLYLIDDLAAELDEAHQKKLIAYLQSQPGQYVITSTQNDHSYSQWMHTDYSSYSFNAETQTFV